MRVYLDYGGTLHLFRKEAPDASYGKRINVPARFLVTPDQGLVQSLWLGRHRATGAVIAECYGNQEETAEVLARVAPEQYDAAEFPLVEHQQPNGVEGARYLAGRIACDNAPRPSATAQPRGPYWSGRERHSANPSTTWRPASSWTWSSSTPPPARCSTTTKGRSSSPRSRSSERRGGKKSRFCLRTPRSGTVANHDAPHAPVEVVVPAGRLLRELLRRGVRGSQLDLHEPVPVRDELPVLLGVDPQQLHPRDCARRGPPGSRQASASLERTWSSAGLHPLHNM